MYNNTSSNPIAGAWQNLRVAAKKDPKKAGILAVLVAVMGGVWAKTLLQPQPATAGAAILAPAGTDAATAAGQSQVGSDKGAGKFAANSPWCAVGLTPAARNLFRVDYE